MHKPRSVQIMREHDIIIRTVDGYGFLPIIQNNAGEEVYRGEFKGTIAEAVAACTSRLEDICD
jgi:hypothetical protein